MELPLRATAVFFFLWALTRALGKRELAQMSAFELVLLIVLGDLIQQGVTQEDYSVTGAFLAAGTIGFWVLVFSYASFRFPRTRRALEGEPVLVVRGGEPLYDAMRLERLTLDEVLEEARHQGIRDLAEVDVGVVEPDGRFSFLRADGGRHRAEDERVAE